MWLGVWMRTIHIWIWGVNWLLLILKLKRAFAVLKVAVRLFKWHLALLLHKVICEHVVVPVDVKGLFFLLLLSEESWGKELRRAALFLGFGLTPRLANECSYRRRQYILLFRLCILCLVQTSWSLLVLQWQHFKPLDADIACRLIRCRFLDQWRLDRFKATVLFRDNRLRSGVWLASTWLLFWLYFNHWFKLRLHLLILASERRILLERRQWVHVLLARRVLGLFVRSEQRAEQEPLSIWSKRVTLFTGDNFWGNLPGDLKISYWIFVPVFS